MSVKYLQNGREIGEKDAKQLTLHQYRLKGNFDQEDFNHAWHSAKQDSLTGELCRDLVFEWSDFILEIELLV